MQWSISVFFLITCAFYAKEESSTHSVKTIQTWSAQERLSCLDTWFVLEKDNCMCGNTFDGIVSCDEYTKEVGVQECFCITRYHIRNTTLAVLGQCMLNCVNNTAISLAVYIYHHVLVSGDNNNSTCIAREHCAVSVKMDTMWRHIPTSLSAFTVIISRNLSPTGCGTYSLPISR